MKTLFNKIEPLPSEMPLKFLGMFEISGKNNKDASELKVPYNNESFPSFNYSSIGKNVFNNDNDKLFLGLSFNYINLAKDLNDHPFLFLEFADLDLRNEVELYNFVSEYGFLDNYQEYDNLKKAEYMYTINNSATNPPSSINNFTKNIRYPNTKQATTSKAPILYESFDSWFRFQNGLRTLIRLWRYLINKSLNRGSGQTHRVLYEDELFNFDMDQLIFADKHNGLYNAILGLPVKNFFKDDKYIDNLLLKNRNNIDETQSIDLTEQYKTHKPDYNQSLIMPQDFLQYFAEEFLKDQLNIGLNSYTPKMNLNGYISFRSELAADGFKISRNLTCKTLGQAIINQFIEAIINDVEYSRCLECQAWMKKGRKKIDKKNYCSNKCRSKAYDRRKKISEDDQIITIIRSLELKESEALEAIKKLEVIEKGISVFEIFSNYLAPNLNGIRKQTFDSLLENCIHNFRVETRPTNLCKHLGLNEKDANHLFPSIKFVITKLMNLKIFPYYDWDFD